MLVKARSGPALENCWLRQVTGVIRFSSKGEPRTPVYRPRSQPGLNVNAGMIMTKAEAVVAKQGSYSSVIL